MDFMMKMGWKQSLEDSNMIGNGNVTCTYIMAFFARWQFACNFFMPTIVLALCKIYCSHSINLQPFSC
jgi:hypothetical protein